MSIGEVDGVEEFDTEEEGKDKSKVKAKAGESEILKKLTGIEESVQDRGALNQLLANPEIRAVLQAQQKGEKVRIVLGDEIPDADSQKVELPENIEGMSNAELSTHILSLMTEVVGSAVKTQLGPLTEKVTRVSGHMEDEVKGRVDKEIKAAQEKFSDFDTYREDMLELSQGGLGLSIEELYLIAKRRKGGLSMPTKDAASTEKPGTPSRRPPRQRQSPAIGRTGFQDIVRQGLERQMDVDVDEMTGRPESSGHDIAGVLERLG